MTSANVSNVPIQAAAIGGASGKAGQPPEKGDFVQFLDQNTKSTENKAPEKQADVKSPVKVESRREKVAQPEKETETDAATTTAEAEKQVDGFSKEAKELLTEKLGVTEEELDQVLETLGLTMLDLTNPAKLAQVVGELQGCEDSVELLLSSEVRELLPQIRDLAEQLQEAVGMTAEELKQFTEAQTQTEQSVQEIPPQTTETAEEVTPEMKTVVTQTEENPQSLKETAKEAPELSDETEAAAETPVKSAEGKSGAQTEESGAQEKQEDAEPVKEARQETKPETDRRSERPVFEHRTPESRMNAAEQGMTLRTSVFEVESRVITTVTGERVDVAHVIDQIVEQARTVISREVTSMEMLLNPEGLGKILMQVSEKEGNITARIYTQDPAVKEALENQIVVLKEQLNETGTKVQSIEVAVATHEFERNLEDGQQENGQPQEQKKQARNLNLNNLDELSGLMSEEEELVAKIMRDNGNTVNFTA